MSYGHTPVKRNSSTDLYIVRMYDRHEHRWFDMSTALPWDEALEVWKYKTNDGTRATSYQDGRYYDIFPSHTHMIANAVSRDG